MDSPKKMNDYWHIPRASLSSSSAASSASSSNRSNKSFSNPPTVAQRALKKSQQHYVNNLNTTNYGQQERAAESVGVNMTKTTMVTHGSRNNSREQTRAGGHTKHMSNARRDSELSVTSAATTAAAAAAVLAAATAAAAKRGSRSSQGSNDSNNSTRSAASGSLLLTAANLERFAEIHKKEQQHRPKHSSKNQMESLTLPNVHSNNRTINTIYNANLTQALHNPSNYTNSNNNSSQNNNTSDSIITVDPNLDFIKTKDLDTVSIASSMHFTMVNGEAGANKKQKRGLCDRGRQVTVLIVSMSTIFLLLIMGMVYALEMRARDMPQS